MERPHVCEICLAFPTTLQAEQTRRIMEVDQEIGDRVFKSFSTNEDAPNKLTVRFEATELKMLRVSVSSFYDYLLVALKCYQEFDDSLRG